MAIHLDLRGRRVLVTGAGQGVGRGIALGFAAAGAAVAINDISPGRAGAVVDEAIAAGGQVVFDVTDHEAVARGRGRRRAERGIPMTGTPARRSTSSTPGTRCTASRTSGRRWRCGGCGRCRGPAGCSVYGTWSSTSHRRSEAAERIEAWRAAVPETAGVGDWVRADVDERLRDEHSTFTWLLEPMFGQAGFAVLSAEYPGVDARYLLEAA